MQTSDELLSTTEYWMKIIQKELSIQMKNYMEEKGLNQLQLSQELGVTKGIIAQVLKGKFNYSLGKLIDLSLAVGVVPHVEFKSVPDYHPGQETKKPERVINLNTSSFLPVKGGKTKMPLQRNENSIAVSLDVHQVSTLTPLDIKIA